MTTLVREFSKKKFFRNILENKLAVGKDFLTIFYGI
jgi:hypothetical protein